MAIIANMTPTMHGNYRVPLPLDGRWAEALNSDAECYGGSGQGNLGGINARDGAAHVTLPPLGTLMLRHEG